MCQLPWTGLEISSSGQYKPCCLYKQPLKGMDVTTHSIKDAMNSKEMEDLRNQFRANKKPAGCEKCWKEETAGKKSKRLLLWDKSPVLGEMHVKKEKIAPRYLEIKLGNICNLKCRICSATSSSLWANEEIKNNPGNKKKYLEINEQSRWPRKENKAFDNLDELLKDVRYFQITGGEPLLIKEQFDILQRCIDLGVANKIEVHYNTNGTIFPEQALKEIWPKFKRVELAFSIDDIGNRFEYQRHPAKWNVVSENIKRITDMNLPNISVQICTTLSFFNAYYLDEMAEQVDEWMPDYWHINCLHHPIEFDVQHLGPKMKDSIVNKLSKCAKRKADMKTAIDYIKSGPINKTKSLLSITQNTIKQLDMTRNESYREVFAEFNTDVLESIDNQ